ncbi:MAG: Cof-type HAD-IIB family hydrolase [Clostridiales bacterium]|nr:Cof-type HAD-IIB family hydrolase [Clostridiales bacterium]
MAETKLIALDLDGTLLNTSKQLTKRNEEALRRAAHEGVQIVPATGRIYEIIPDFIRSLDFVNYMIVANGSWVMKMSDMSVAYRAEIPCERAVELMEYMDTLPVIYDCYMDGKAWMSEAQWQVIDDYIENIHYRKMVREFRKPVPDLKRFVADSGHGIMKTQCFFKDRNFRPVMIQDVSKRFPDIAASSSLPNNVELNDIESDKGKALLCLADQLGIPRECTVAFGDGLNDITMLRAAGTGIAMKNADDEVKAISDRVAGHCDHDGVASMISELMHWD